MHNGTAISTDQANVLAYNLLLSVNFLHSAGVMHRDLQPKNVLVDKMCRVKICDFGWSRSVKSKTGDDKKTRNLSPNICTRPYRPPENILLSENYDHKSDIWQYGCTVAELFNCCANNPSKATSRTLFKDQGESPASPVIDAQLVKILRVLGSSDDRTSQLYTKQ